MVLTSGSRVGGVVLSVDAGSSVPPFRQVVDQVVRAVRSGALTAGTRMPTVRSLADELGVSTATAAKMYRELESAGVLEGRGRSGTFVAEPTAAGAALARAAEEFASLAHSAGFSAEAACESVLRVLTTGLNCRPPSPSARSG